MQTFSEGVKIITNWEQLKTEMTALSQEDWDEIDLKVKIIGEVINARQEENLAQQALEKT